MPKRIILVRHGETDYNKQKIMQGHTDVFLNPAGLKQAINAAKRLKEEKVDAIYSSDLKRTLQTAHIISKKLRKDIKKTGLIRERGFGDLEGLKDIEAVKFHRNFSWKRGFIDPASQYLNIETDITMTQRIEEFIKLLKTHHTNESVLVITHGGVIHIILKIFNINNLGDKEEKLFENTSINFFEKRKNSYFLKRVSTKNEELYFLKIRM